MRLTHPALLRDACYIGGQWRKLPQHFTVTDPATGKAIGNVPDAGEKETLEAIAAADAALPAWRGLTAKARTGLLRRWYELIQAHESDLAALLTAEQGKPLAEAEGEIRYAASFVEW
ncbi:MAG: aldehyde dehydrogenase family protein, partial [Alphaproteobacteria bacterium]|nr:aldehyde dehydrogenase family protein [Alphaproteobacteria bacterium]